MNILVTGGASGLGEAIVRSLAVNQLNRVYFTYHSSKNNAENLVTEFSNTVSIACDYSNINTVRELVASIAHFDLDVLINNAYTGSFLKTHFHKITSSDFLDEFTVNIIPVIEITQAAIQSFRKKKQGKIITILTSALSEKAPVGSSIYMANKAYLEKLTHIWSIENARFNISSNSISPSLMRTNLTASLDERLLEQISTNNPMKTVLATETVAKTLGLLIQAPTNVNGTDIVVN